MPPPSKDSGGPRFLRRTEIGRGSAGVVYRVYDDELQAEVALKILDGLGPDAVYRLKREFRTLAGMLHGNLVELYELVVNPDECFFTMELIDGRPFVDHVRNGITTAVAPDAAALCARLLTPARQLVDAIAHLHAKAILHRDIKPSNVLVREDGRPTVLDFGLATVLHGDQPHRGAAGTPTYMAPEQLWGRPPEPAADWYAFGVLLYEALTGRVPFAGPTHRALRAKGLGPPEPPSRIATGIPPALDALVCALLEPNPSRRPLPADISACLDEAATGRPSSRPARAHDESRMDEEIFVGRAAELARMRGALDRLADGHPVIVDVVGPSGMGKSELIRRFLAPLEDAAATLVLRGRCHPDESVPYKAFDAVIDRMSDVLVAAGPDFLRGRVADAAALVRAFPVLARVPVLSGSAESVLDTDPVEIRRRSFQALRELIAAIASDRRLVIWIDDVQWADADSAALLRDVLRPADAPRVLLVLSYRSEDRARAPVLSTLAEIFADLPAAWRATIDLGPLPAEDAHALASSLLGRSQLAADVAAQSGGVPFLISQIARPELHRTDPDDSGAHFPNLEEAIHARLGRLPDAARDVLEVAAVAGRPLDRGVALDATGLSARGRPVLRTLAHQSLVRITSVGGRPAFEIYHDRIRENLLAGMSSGATRRRHAQLVDALTHLEHPDPFELFTHELGAGYDAAAVVHGTEAAERAAAALAFDRAASLYRQVLAIADPAEKHPALLARLAEALANAGQSHQAAQAFDDASDALPSEVIASAEWITLRRRAAELYLRTGHLDRGIERTRQALAAVGIGFPQSTGRAIVDNLAQRAKLLWRGLDFTPRPTASISARAMLRLETCHGVAFSLSPVDQISSDAIGVRHLIEALDLGERSHILRSLGMEAIREAQIGGLRLRRRAARMVTTVDRLAGETGDPYDRASFHFATGCVAYMAADWPTAYEHCDRGVQILRTSCTGVAWEVVTFTTFGLSALAHMGELRLLADRLPTALGDADERGDLYAALGFRAGVLNLMWLARDDPDEGRRQMDSAMARWPEADRFHVQHYLHLIGSVQADLYVGDPWAAWGRILAAWPRAKRGLFLSLESPRVELWNLRARAALAAAAAWHEPSAAASTPPDRRWPRERLLRLAARDAARLHKETIASAKPFAAMIRGGIAEQEGERGRAIALLILAADGFAATRMGLYRAVAMRQAGLARGGEEGAHVVSEADAWMAAQDVRAPDRISRVCAARLPS